MFLTRLSFFRRTWLCLGAVIFTSLLYPVVAAEPTSSANPALPVKDVVQTAPDNPEPKITTQSKATQTEDLSKKENAGAQTQLTVAQTSVVPAPKPTPSRNVTVNLMHRMVERGLLSAADADDLVKQAENDAALARERGSGATVSSARAGETPPDLLPPDLPGASGAASAGAASLPAPPAAPPFASSDDEVRVSYVPEIVRRQIADEVRQEVMQQARDENWANPRAFPTWALRLTPFADFRLRAEGIFFPAGNDNTGAFPNFNAINTGAPFDVTGNTFSPQLNVDQDRFRARVRARFGAQMDLDEGFTFGLRIATGESNTPTSTNQSLGVANGAQGGNFSKYSIWLDRAFVRYEAGGKPSQDFVLNLGRFDNPFFSPSELVWDDDLGFDGLAVGGRYKVYEGITPFGALGAFPVFNTELNFSSNRPSKFQSEDKYLLAAQVGSSFRFNSDFSAKVAAAFYDFENIEGKLSSPFVPLTTADQGDTDDSRPAFAQKGNTYFPIRNITPTADNNFGTTKQFQYFGLASRFRELDFAGTLEYAHFDPFHLTLFGELVHNVAFDYNDVNAKAINNRGPTGKGGKQGSFAGGNTGWVVGLKAGTPAFEKRWDWYVGVNYRYVESDATVDGFNDSDFGLGGTNLKGYSIFGAVALSPRVGLYLRYMSADEVAGPTFANDTVQFDFNAKF